MFPLFLIVFKALLPSQVNDQWHVVKEVENVAVARLLLQAHPPAVRARNTDGALPLHYAVSNLSGENGLQVIELLLRAYPQAAREKNKAGWLPLHQAAAAMGGREGLRVIKLLLAEYPEGAREKLQGFTPLHMACDNKAPATLDMIKVLLSAFPESIRQNDNKGFSPYQRAAHFKLLPPEAIEFLRRAQEGGYQSRPFFEEPPGLQAGTA